jgi:G3E family GTPase
VNAELPRRNAYSLSGGGFVVGPVFAQHLAITLSLTGEQTALASLLLRYALSGKGNDGLVVSLASTLGRDEAHVRRLMEGFPQDLLDTSAENPLGVVTPLLNQMAMKMAHHYGALAATERPASPPRSKNTDGPAAVRNPRRERARILILSGFLGSGKTTLLGALLGDPRLARSLCIVNEVGEAAVDHITLSTVTGIDDISLMRGGCLCCAFEHELVACLRRAALAPGGPPDIVIETSGVADPVAIASAILSDAALRRSYDLAGICVTVDAVSGLQALETRNGANQLAGADFLVVTKTDLVNALDLAAFVRELRGHNRSAQVIYSSLAAPPVAELVDAMFGQTPLAGARRRQPVVDGASHDEIAAVAIHPKDAALDAARLFCDVAMFAKADELLRLKGWLNARGGSLLVNAVRTAFHEIAFVAEPVARPALTLIGPGLDPLAVAGLWRILGR